MEKTKFLNYVAIKLNKIHLHIGINILCTLARANVLYWTRFFPPFRESS